MRIANMLHFTEHHRFYIYRDFALSSLCLRVLHGFYQPMIGGGAISLYMTLYQQLAEDQTGYSALEQQRKLFLSLDVDFAEAGRKYIVEQTSRLEATGLLQTSRKYVAASDDYIYEYRLFAPMAPAEFFANQHLALLLRDKIGKYAVLALRKQFIQGEPEELTGAAESTGESLSVPFYELFQLNTKVIDLEFEQALQESAPAKEGRQALDVTTSGIQYAEIITRFPRESVNRKFVERLKYRSDHMAMINMTAKKYALSLQELSRLLDEDGVFDDRGELQETLLQTRANLYFRQDKKRDEDRERRLSKVEGMSAQGAADDAVGEKPVQMEYYLEVPPIFHGHCDVHQYNSLLRNEPYTLVLRRFFPKGSVPDRVLDIFEKVDLNYRMSGEVINVLIHYLHTYKDSSWTKAYIDSIVADMLGKRVETYEQAVDYIREEIKKRRGGAQDKLGSGKQAGGTAAARARGGRSQKPKIAIVGDVTDRSKLSEEELAAIRQKAEKRDRKPNSST